MTVNKKEIETREDVVKTVFGSKSTKGPEGRKGMNEVRMWSMC